MGAPMKLLGPNSRRCDFKEKLNLFSGRHQTMSVKSRFHPRNIYKNPPNFKELAIEYPDFRKYVKQELCGRFSIDYQDQGAVKELTRTLLKRDFNLDVEIDDSRLVPRIPLCLNYILWIEDLLNVLPPEESKSGIDIGTGNVCIYSLLAARRGWKMLATEIDPYNFKSATNNIIKNDLFDTISLKMVPDSNHLLIAVLDANSKYDFCMCNPPFFDYREKPINRTLRRAQLKQVASNVQSETCTEGGEVSFITKLMKESVQLKEQIKIFTTLVGKKCDFLYLKKELQKIHPKSTAFTEFCQGRTTRWGIAWTFLDISLKNVGQTAEKKSKRKMKSALQFEIPANKFCDPNEVFDSLKRALNDLEISFKVEVEGVSSLSFKACKNTWSHQRKKKRLAARQTDKQKIQNSEGPVTEISESVSPKRFKKDSDSFQINNDDSESESSVEGFIFLKTENLSIVFEMSWLSGNKEYFHQIFQYFKNHWNEQT